MKTYGFLLILMAALLHASAAAAQDISANPAPTSGAFDTVVDEYFDLYFGFHPTAATAAGFHQYDEKLEDLSRAGLEREAAALRSFLPKLEKARSAPLPQQSADDLEFVQSQIRSRLLELETIRMWEKDPDPYASQPAYSLFLLMKRHFAPPEVRLRSIIARERQIPAMLDAARHNLKNPPKVYTNVALQQIPGTIEFFRRDVPEAFSVVKDPKLLAEFRASNQQAITALEKYENFLREDLLPVSHGDFRLGAENFQKKLLYDEMVDIPLARLREIGYADLRRNQEQLKQIAAQIDPRRSTGEVLATLRNDHPAPDQLLQTFRDALGSLRRFIEQNHIVTIPSTAEPVVEETPPFSRALTSAAMDTPGPYETKDTQGIFEVTLPDRSWKPDKVREYMEEYSRGIIVSTATHEVYPGHYLQYLWSLRAPSKVRKLLYCDSNSEGWAHYTEQMMLDEGYSKAIGTPMLVESARKL